MQLVPSVFAVGAEQVPASASQVPGSWQASPFVHTSGVPAHVPFVHTSPVVQALPSVQAGLPVFGTGAEHTPVAGAHVPGSLHWSPLQTTGVPVQVPLAQLSPLVHALPSLQAVPFGAVGFEQTFAVQVPAV